MTERVDMIGASQAPQPAKVAEPLTPYESMRRTKRLDSYFAQVAKNCEASARPGQPDLSDVWGPE